MHHFVIILKKMVSAIRRENLHRIILIILCVLFLGSGAFVYFEKNIGFIDALWWSIVTMTTVGYGDISPETTGGRIVGLIVMLMGIGFLGLLTATIASAFIENKLMRNKGMKPTLVKDHYIICGWNFRGLEIVKELRADAKSKNAAIVVIADIPEKPVDDDNLHFVKGDVSADSLALANASEAQVAIVLSDDLLDVYARDAKTILKTLTIKYQLPNLYTCVELMDPKNIDHCRMANADEIIVTGELSTNMLVQASLDHGITRMISELVSNRYGKELFKIPVPRHMVNRIFFEVMCELKEKYDILCVGVDGGTDKDFITNPENSYRIREEDQLIVIAEERPQIED